jgi:hypothetical protein
MNFSNILRDIEKADPEVYEKLSGRRQILKSFSSKVAVAALPIAVGSLFKKAYGKTTDVIVDALNFGLQLEYLEYTFFRTGINTGNLIPAADMPGFNTILAQELEHLNFLTTTITTLGGTPVTPDNYSSPTTIAPYVPAAYDFTGGGAYSQVFTDYPTFLIIAQIFEDTVVHAYKGQLPTLLGNALFGQIMELQCTEARHAAHIRLIRRQPPVSALDLPAPWITSNIAPTATLQPFYNGDGGIDTAEDNVVQNGVTITDLPDTYSTTGTVPQISASAAFDETLDKTTVLALLKQFML